MLTLVVGMGGMLLLSFIVAYIFGREYIEGTAKNMLALPVARHWFALAKLVAAALWWAVLVAAVVAETFVIGLAMALPGLSASLAERSVRDVALAAALTFLLAPSSPGSPRSGVATCRHSVSRWRCSSWGDVIGKTGWGPWFPWSTVPVLIGSVGQRATSLAPGSVVVVGLTFLAGIAATIAQLRYADNAQ